MSARLSARLALALSLAVAVVAGVLFMFVVGHLKSRVWGEAEARLRSEVLLLQDGLCADLETVEVSELQARTQKFGQALDLRITVIGPDGTALSDSEANPQTMDNLASRPEVVDSLSNEFGICHRFGPALGVDALFVAKAIRRGDRVAGWIRASVRAERIDAGIRATKWGTIAVIGIAALAAFMLGALWMRRRPAPVD